ncbi:MAG: hypothetical protein ACLQVK_04970 [Acidimicrobiales bacterium]
MTKRTHERRERAVALGPPIYGLTGQRPLDDYGWSGWKDDVTALKLEFGTKGRLPRLGVETTIEAVNEFRMLCQLVVFVHDKHKYPLTIEERTASVGIDGEVVEYRILAVGEDRWCGWAPVGDRWAFLKGDRVPAIGIRLERINIADL